MLCFLGRIDKPVVDPTDQALRQYTRLLLGLSYALPSLAALQTWLTLASLV